jgi:hypothetical protein
MVPGTPQENVVSERMNMIIMECARSMRLHAGFPLQFWVDVVDIVLYLMYQPCRYNYKRHNAKSFFFLF